MAHEFDTYIYLIHANSNIYKIDLNYSNKVIGRPIHYLSTHGRLVIAWEIYFC